MRSSPLPNCPRLLLNSHVACPIDGDQVSLLRKSEVLIQYLFGEKYMKRKQCMTGTNGPYISKRRSYTPEVKDRAHGNNPYHTTEPRDMSCEPRSIWAQVCYHHGTLSNQANRTSKLFCSPLSVLDKGRAGGRQWTGSIPTKQLADTPQDARGILPHWSWNIFEDV